SPVLGHLWHSCPSFPVFSCDRELRELRTADKNFAVTASPAPRVGWTFVLGTRVGGSMESGMCAYFDNKGQEGTKQQRKDLSHNESRSSLLTKVHDASMPLTQFTANA
ncbi:hypothetical protein LEMLEM_LOCUS21317, partial [Lemmus lemmus]